MKIENSVLDVLNNSKVEGNKLFLPPGQLDRKLYVKVANALSSIEIIWDKKLKCHLSGTDIEEKLEEIINTGEYNSLKEKKNEFNYFPTPKNIVLRMIELAELEENHSVLEPSVGTGNIAEEIYKITTNLVILDINNDHAIKAKNKCPNSKLFVGDFLTFDDGIKYDRIIANPPFSKQRDVDHISHMWKFLKPNGILVSICSPSPFFRNNKKSENFRAFLEENNADVHDLPEGVFKESGTNIHTKLIKIKK